MIKVKKKQIDEKPVFQKKSHLSNKNCHFSANTGFLKKITFLEKCAQTDNAILPTLDFYHIIDK